MLSLLAQGNTGSEILSILDTLDADNVSEVADSTYLPILGQSIPTLEEIAFWLLVTVCLLVVRQSVSDVDTGGHLCYDALVTPSAVICGRGL